MQSRTQTLLDYLRTPNPIITDAICPDAQKSLSNNTLWEIPSDVCEWEDFNYDSLNAIYDGELSRILHREFNLDIFSDIPPFPFCTFFDENSLESLLIKWNHSVVSEALTKAQSVLYHMQDHPIFMVRGGQARSPYPEKNWMPDWGSVQPSLNDSSQKPKSLLLGDTKVSIKWSSAMIAKDDDGKLAMTEGQMRPLKQIYSYCLRNETRYGYIITDAELFVVRVRLGEAFDSQQSQQQQHHHHQNSESFGSMGDGGTSQESQGSVLEQARHFGVLDYKAIPWTTNGSGDAAASRGVGENTRQTTEGMTVNLALWWLHLIALRGQTHIAFGEEYGLLRDVPLGRSSAATVTAANDATGAVDAGNATAVTAAAATSTDAANEEAEDHIRSLGYLVLRRRRCNPDRKVKNRNRSKSKKMDGKNKYRDGAGGDGVGKRGRSKGPGRRFGGGGGSGGGLYT